MAVFHPVSSQSEFTTRVGGGAANCSQCSRFFFFFFFFCEKCIKQTNVTCNTVRDLRSVLSALKRIFLFLALSNSLSIFSRSFIPTWNLLLFACPLNPAATHQLCGRQMCVPPLSGGGSCYVSLLHRTPGRLKNMKRTRPRQRISKRFVQFIWWRVFAVFFFFRSPRLISPPAVPLGINFTSRRDDCHLPSGVCLSERPCVLDVATGVKQMDRLLPSSSEGVRWHTRARAHTHTHVCTVCYSHIRDQVFAHSPGGWQACRVCVCVCVCVCQTDNVRARFFSAVMNSGAEAQSSESTHTLTFFPSPYMSGNLRSSSSTVLYALC